MDISKTFNLNQKNKIICKNYIVFVLFLKNFFKNKKITFFMKPVTKSNITLLRSPYRHKLTRHQITLNRFLFDLKLCFPLKKSIEIENASEIGNMVKDLNTFITSFETNICNQHKIKFIVKYKYNNFFNINHVNRN
jgi:hypothetical protein